MNVLRDREIGDLLRDLPVPEHGDGFFEELKARLRFRQTRRPTRAWLVPALATVTALAVVGANETRMVSLVDSTRGRFFSDTRKQFPPVKPGEEPAESGAYRKRTVLDVQLGDADAPGVLNGSEDRVRAANVGVLDGGELVVGDQAGHRILRFAADGDLLGEIPTPGLAPFQAVGLADGALAYLAKNGSTTTAGIISADGSTTPIELAPLASKLVAPGLALTADGLVVHVGQSTTLVARTTAKGYVPLPAGEQEAERQRGYAFGDAVYRLDRSGSRIVRRADADASEQPLVALDDDGVLQLQSFLGTDADGALYAAFARRVDDGSIRVAWVECRKYDADGKLVARFTMRKESIESAPSMVSAAVTPDGRVYLALVQDDRFRVLCFEPLSGK